MTTKYFAILTNQGAARLANATMLGTKLNITQMAVGDGNGTLPTPDPAQTKLINQTRIAPINSLSVDANDAGQIIAEQIIPENEGGFFIREIGLYDDDGILIAVANCPETYKPLLAEGSGRTQTIRMILVVSSTSAITLKIDPSVVLATRKYVDDAVIEVKSYADGLMRNHEQSRNHPDATTTAKGFTQLNSSVTDDRETQSATPKAVKIAMDNANARLAKERNLADLPNPALARQNLQLGDSSTKNTGTTANTVAAGDDARITGAMQKSQNGADIPDVAKFLQNLGLVDLAKTSENNTFTGDQKFTGGVSLPANTAYKGIGLQAWFDDKQKEDATLTALSGKDVAGLLSYLGLTSAAKTDAQNTFTQKQTFSGSVALPSDTTLNGTGLEYLFDSKLDASKALGMGQTWVDVTASRTAGVTYTNTTTRPICVSIPETADGQRGLYVGGVLTAFARGADSDSTLFAIVPPGAQYIFSGAFSSWSELR
ncbi:phage tail protein [Citrobacter portucalensis]|uniref:phage tail protein n=2 Tax=Citrobacter portucalensis TaxID=1639133 RepID=UPI000F6F23C4|nr:phage tail protein [Citrobacter portucalensis]VEC15340.1 tail fiber protein [Citrobacter portucalensis]